MNLPIPLYNVDCLLGLSEALPDRYLIDYKNNEKFLRREHYIPKFIYYLCHNNSTDCDNSFFLSS